MLVSVCGKFNIKSCTISVDNSTDVFRLLGRVKFALDSLNGCVKLRVAFYTAHNCRYSNVFRRNTRDTCVNSMFPSHNARLTVQHPDGPGSHQ